MNEVWVDPATKRIKAVYRGCSTTSTVWADRGYEKYDTIEDWMLPMEPPKPTTPEYPSELMLKGEDGENYSVTVNPAGNLVVKKKHV